MVFYPNVINTCHDCAQPCRGVWAPNVDVAIAGGGKCAACAGIKAGQPVYTGEPAGTSPEPPAEAQQPVVLDLSDGVDEAEASAAGQALAQRKAETKTAALKAPAAKKANRR